MFGHLLVNLYLIQMYSDIRSCWNFHEYHTLVWGPSGLYNPRRYHTVYLPNSWYMYFLIYTPNIPQTSSRYHQHNSKISPIYPPKYIPQIYPRYTFYIPQIYPRYKKDTPKIYPQNIPIDMMMRLSSGHFWGGVFGGDSINRIFTVHLRFV